jgi:hypothetical protein
MLSSAGTMSLSPEPSAAGGQSKLDALIRPLAERLNADHMSALGIANTMRLAHAYNRLKLHRQDAWRRALYRQHLTALLDENGPPPTPRIRLEDGWAIDTSMSLPHLDRILEDAEEIIAERAGTRRKKGSYRSYFQNLWTHADVGRYPSFLDFATASSVLAPVADALESIPVLSTSAPPGIRFTESNVAFDDDPDRPKDSQLYHIDFYSLPNVYVIVLLRDTTHENGPLTFLPRSVSQKVAAKLNYWSRRCPYRVPDEDIYDVADRKDVIEFCGKRGTVLFIESSGCFHYGSRKAVKPRFQLMLGYTGTYRTDFSEVVSTPKPFPIGPSDSRLRKMVLDRYMLA